MISINMQLIATVINIVNHPWVFSGKKSGKIRQKKTTVKKFLHSVEFFFNKCENFFSKYEIFFGKSRRDLKS